MNFPLRVVAAAAAVSAVTLALSAPPSAAAAPNLTSTVASAQPLELSPGVVDLSPGVVDEADDSKQKGGADKKADSADVTRKGLPYGVVPDGGRQLIIAHTAGRSSTRGTVELWELGSSGTWTRAHRFTQARFGYNGLATASAKYEGDGKTPMGQYKVPFAFGTSAKPSGTAIEYRKVDGNDQWCGRSTSPHYNSWMDAPDAGCPAHAAEVLSDYYQYNHAAVIGYNPKGTPKRGSAIFLHTHGKGSTAGCVSVSTAQARTLLRWMDPDKTPRIVIAPRGELKNQ